MTDKPKHKPFRIRFLTREEAKLFLFWYLIIHCIAYGILFALLHHGYL